MSAKASRCGFIFDLDDTLWFTSQIWEDATLWLDLSKRGAWITEMYKLFQRLVQTGSPVFILSGRHPILQKELEDIFIMPGKNQPKIICRDFCLQTTDMKRLAFDSREKEKFFDILNDWKVRNLNKIKTDFNLDFAIYWDDQAKYIDISRLSMDIQFRDPTNTIIFPLDYLERFNIISQIVSMMGC